MTSTNPNGAQNRPGSLLIRLFGALLICAALYAFSTSSFNTHSFETTLLAPLPVVSVLTPNDTATFTVGPVTRANEHPHVPVAIQLGNERFLAVTAVGLTDTGEMELPPNPSDVGWYMPGGVRPGRNGTAVLAAHVDSRVHGLGPFSLLHAIAVGSVVTIRHADGEESLWHVTGRQQVLKEDLADTGIFAPVGSPRIALVTCGGRFDATSRTYDSNIVVTATPYGAVTS